MFKTAAFVLPVVVAALATPVTLLPPNNNNNNQHHNACLSDFNPAILDTNALHRAVITIAKKLDIASILHLNSLDELMPFLNDMSDFYNTRNPYHTYAHAVDVLNATAELLLPPNNLAHYLTPIDVVVLFFSALGHDAGHPGRSNAFLIHRNTLLAQKYNKHTSLLEHHAADITTSLVQQHHLLRTFTPSQRQGILDTIVFAILQTDMANHNRVLSDLKSSVDQNTSQLNRRHLVAAVLHAADISNPSRPSSIAVDWSRRINEEFSSQYRDELVNDLVTSWPTDPSTNDVMKQTTFFVRAFVLPLFETLKKLSPYINRYILDLKERYSIDDPTF